MAKIMTDAELSAHINQALRNVENMLNTLRTSADPKEQQKSAKIAYWLNTYSDRILNENSFSSSSLPSFEYRSIVSVDFGFRLGCELGGLHYAVVLDKNNNRSSDTITVVPLTSIKEHTQPSSYTILLTEGIYVPCIKKLTNMVNTANKIIKKSEEIYDKAESESDFEKRLALKEEARMIASHAKDVLKECTKIHNHIMKLKGGTAVSVGQITTISKRRIKNPTSHKSTLYNIKLSVEEMEMVQEAIKNLYITGT